MAKSSSLYIRIDPKVKAEIEQIYARYGMSITDAINIFLYQSRNIQGLPFDLRPSVHETNDTSPSMKGALKKYADLSLRAKEDGAWENAVTENHDGI